MSRRVMTLKKAVMLLSMGGATFACAFLGAAPGFNCTATNANFVDFYQGVGDASIEAFRDSTANIIGSDFDAIVLTPTAGFFTALWDNWIDRQFPLDPGQNTIWRQ